MWDTVNHLTFYLSVGLDLYVNLAHLRGLCVCNVVRKEKGDSRTLTLVNEFKSMKSSICDRRTKINAVNYSASNRFSDAISQSLLFLILLILFNYHDRAVFSYCAQPLIMNLS